MFRGSVTVTIDVKGRIAVPNQYRKFLLDDNAGLPVMTIDTEERCLQLYPFSQWRQLEEQLTQLSAYQPATRRVKRLLIGHAHELELDRHGRIQLPYPLYEYAGLDEIITLVGQGNKLEIWGEAQWNSMRDRLLADGLDMSAGMPHEIQALAL